MNGINEIDANLARHVVRLEDLPYYKSPPMQFTFTQSATLTLGQYPFTAAKAVVGNNKNLTDNAMIYIKAITFSADIDVQDYQTALKLSTGATDVPTFSMFLQSEARAPVFVDPIQLGNYYSNQEYKKLFLTKQAPNELTAFFRGTLQQHGGLAGVTEINLTMDVWVQQLTNDNFIEGLKKNYPNVGGPK